MKLNNKDYGFMSLGCNCASIPLLAIDRIKGPIDNVGIKEPEVLEELITNSYIRNFVKTVPTIKEKIGGLNDTTYIFNGYEIFHNNPTTDKYLKELTHRINIFNGFLNDIYCHKQNYFIITLNKSFIDYRTRQVNKAKLAKLLEIFTKYNLLKNVLFVEVKQLNNDVIANEAYSYINNGTVDLADILKINNGRYIQLQVNLSYEQEDDGMALHNSLKQALRKELQNEK